MSTQPIIVEETFNASAEQVWNAITDKDQMKQWYFDIAAFAPEVGCEFQFTGQGVKGQEYLHLCKIIEVVPQQKLQHSWTYKGYEGYSLVTFELYEEGEKTRLKLIHDGLDSFPSDNPDFATQNFVEGWTYIIKTALKNFLEKAPATN
jgi:uncharacterized protein YndB with AHSA1/START domain